jgi:hypothetical protein
MNKFLMVGAVVLGIVFIVVGSMYFSTPAGSLPGFMPGFEAGSTHIHLKHAIGSLVIALGLFAFAWFQGGPRKSL